MNKEKNRLEKSDEIYTPMHGQLIYDQGTKSLQCRKNSFLNKKCWETGWPHAKKKGETGSLSHTQNDRMG